MKEDEIKWNKRYSSSRFPQEPSQIVISHYQLARVGKALDIAAGNCRNSIFLAEKGFQVDAVDISKTGLELQENKAGAITLICQDLDTYRITENSYDLIININFLDRHLFPCIRKGLKPGGTLIFETFMDPRLVNRELDERKRGQYLDRNELLHSFLCFNIVFYKEEKVTFINGDPIKKATLVAIKEHF
ncbi:methyltransferase domain-containing protein [bacterium]|nr:methyltransferase domain-containing protein [bacterium]